MPFIAGQFPQILVRQFPYPLLLYDFRFKKFVNSYTPLRNSHKIHDFLVK
nr:MAG TPA: hypothetical protein [Caudoviricetes sp.]